MQTLANGAEFIPASDRSLLVSFSDRISPERHGQIVQLLRLLDLEPVSGVRNLHPAYSSLLVTFNPLMVNHTELETALRARLERTRETRLPDPRKVEIPVRYGNEYGPDLNDVAALHGITVERVIELHSSTEYVVYFLGFVPGFAYLGEMPDELLTPRLATPRRSVPPGSVGIAGKQTGVYPFATPGGWRVIGRTPLAMFQSESGSRLAIGDRVRFVPISEEQFSAIEKEQAKT